MYENKSTDRCTAFDLGCSWLTGTSPAKRDISGHDPMAQEMKNSPEAIAARRQMKQRLRGGCRIGMVEDFSRNLGADGQSQCYKGFLEDLGGRNRSRAFLGSFQGTATVTGCWGCCAVVEFRIRNTAGWESATRLPPPLGYDNPDSDAVITPWPPRIDLDSPKSILPNNCFGPFGRNVDITISWKETVCP